MIRPRQTAKVVNLLQEFEYLTRSLTFADIPCGRGLRLKAIAPSIDIATDVEINFPYEYAKAARDAFMGLLRERLEQVIHDLATYGVQVDTSPQPPEKPI